MPENQESQPWKSEDDNSVDVLTPPSSPVQKAKEELERQREKFKKEGKGSVATQHSEGYKEEARELAQKKSAMAARERARGLVPASNEKKSLVDPAIARMAGEKAMREQQRMVAATQEVQKRINTLANTQEGRSALVRRVTVQSKTQEPTLSAVRRDMAEEVTSAQRDTMIKAATVESARTTSTLGAVRREMNAAFVPKAEPIPEVQPLPESASLPSFFVVEPEPVIDLSQFKRSEEPKGWVERSLNRFGIKKFW